MSLHKSLKKITFDDLIIEDLKDYTIVNKPPYLASLEDRNDSMNLLSLARTKLEDYQLCHRLDKETSGIIVFAKNPEAYRNFAMQLEDRKVKKVYHAFLSGLHMFEDFEAEEPLYVGSSKSRVDFRDGKPALTLISTLETFKKHTLVKCFPVTGRLHQIRVHLAYHEAPIINDITYGGTPAYLSEIKKNYNRNKWEEERSMIDRVALHASTVAFLDMDGEVIEIEAPYPKDLSVLYKHLKKFN